MAAKSSNSSFLAAVEVAYSSETALHKAIASSQILLFLSILVSADYLIPDYTTMHFSKAEISASNPSF